MKNDLQWGSDEGLFQFGQIEMKIVGKVDHLDGINPALIPLDIFKEFIIIHLWKLLFKAGVETIDQHPNCPVKGSNYIEPMQQMSYPNLT